MRIGPRKGIRASTASMFIRNVSSANGVAATPPDGFLIEGGRVRVEDNSVQPRSLTLVIDSPAAPPLVWNGFSRGRQRTFPLALSNGGIHAGHDPKVRFHHFTVGRAECGD